MKIEYIGKKSWRKEERIKAIIKERGQEPGVAHIFSALEKCKSYKPWYDKGQGRAYLKQDSGKCLHYYVYFIDEDYGLCYVRIPTWCPFRLQFYCNGHSWLAQQLKQRGIECELMDNAFVDIADFELANQVAAQFLEMGAFTARAKQNFQQNLEKVYEMFPRLKERMKQKTGTLSGGEQQMVAVARGLMAEPEVLMIDELSLGLAPVLVLDLFEVLQRLKAEGLTMLLVEQNVQMALAVSDYAYVLADGRVELEGPSRELAKNEHVRSAYLGI